MSVRHHLKILPEYFEALKDGRKTFEIRHDDRGFKEGDTLSLNEWQDGYTGRSIDVHVTYITDFEQKPGYVVLGIQKKVREDDDRNI
ncbi:MULTISPECIES: ASCH/PUA domain-containing protein [Bacillus]|uniref:ASCH/PUA domain-containing protein n=1 Tax=Bacillus TaxID=1386 RepID=UPI00224A52F2|nr:MULTISPECIES: ASCH/PUA domain-containing protein [Bacillus]MCX2854258.1 DUF3850 domain-containing protein [Bacillus sp. KeR2]MEC3796966.1 DUF3850 domain-containing protein [Bacillus velezensis]MED0777810.1 DUF3850 domain-containing protein [Bacillus siamensis]MED0778012.1 DUF3850 domain-containing protein [Bacillus siamensis]MED0832758.1 DUF3850 domain-containing protein [Bacillus siamensis]